MKKLIYILIGCLLSLHITFADKKTVVKTPIGSDVTAWICDEMSKADIDYWDQYYASRYPRAVMVGRSSSTYNCHGYAWHMSEGGSAVWIGYSSTFDEDIYMEDGSYVEVAAGTAPRKVSYYGGDHSAITTDQLGIFISKWNRFPLYRHAYDDCPYINGTSLRYFVNYRNFDMGGSDFICKGTAMTFSLNYQPIKPISWIVPSSLRILAGQGTSSITVEPINASSSQGWIEAKIGNAVISKLVTMNGIDVTSIRGNSRCKLNTPQTYNADIGVPRWPQGLNWKWEIATYIYPAPTFSSINSQMNVTFTKEGSYTLRCWIVSPCGFNMGTGYLYVNVGYNYSVQLDPQSGNLQITPTDNLIDQNNRSSSFSTYEIIHTITGKVAAKGRFDNSSGLSTYLSGLTKGIYIIKVEGPNGEKEVQKLSY